MASASSQVVDFSKVKDGGNFNKKRIPAGDYLATITKVEDAKAKDETFQYLVSIKIDKHPSSVLPYYCKLQENQLWKLRNLLIAAGKTVPKKRQKVDLNVVVGKKIGVTIEDTEYEGKDQSEIAGVFPAAELGELPAQVDDDDETEDEEEAEEADTEEEVEEEEPEAEEEEPEEEEAEDEGDEWDAITDRLELRKALKKVAPDVKTASSQSEEDIRNLIRAAVLAKAKPAKAAAKPAAKKPAAKKTTVSDEDLEELDIDDL